MWKLNWMMMNSGNIDYSNRAFLFKDKGAGKFSAPFFVEYGKMRKSFLGMEKEVADV